MPEDMRAEVAPKNILMIGPTGVGKTEIARRLAKLTGAPFIKVEATKYTEVGYYGRDVESMVRELVENAIGLVRETERVKVEGRSPPPRRRAAARSAGARRRSATTSSRQPDSPERHERHATKMRTCWPPVRSTKRKVELSHRAKSHAHDAHRHGHGTGGHRPARDVRKDHAQAVSRAASSSVAEARRVMFEQECDALINQEKVNAAAIELAENHGHDLHRRDRQGRGQRKHARGLTSRGKACSATCCRSSKGQPCKPSTATSKPTTCCSLPPGAFHRASPSDLMPELQGRFPIRVELSDLTKDDFVRILTEPKNALTKQYTPSLATEGVTFEFAPTPSTRWPITRSG